LYKGVATVGLSRASWDREVPCSGGNFLDIGISLSPAPTGVSASRIDNATTIHLFIGIPTLFHGNYEDLMMIMRMRL
jgi:hypothetical protein